MSSNVRHIVKDAIKRFISPCDIEFFKSISQNNVSVITESSRVAIKPISKRFDHLKWKLNDSQKQFLEDFVNIDIVADKDLKYASNLTGIPIDNLKSIRNTYKIKEELEGNPSEDAMEAFNKFDKIKKWPNAIEAGIGGRKLGERDAGKETKLFPINPSPEFRNKSLRQIEYENSMPKLYKTKEVKIPEYLYEWLTFVIKGDNRISVSDTKVVDKLMAGVKDKKYIRVLLKNEYNEHVSSGLDKLSHKKTEETNSIEKILTEFNTLFNTNFLITNQYTSSNGLCNIDIENYQIVKNGIICNKNNEDDWSKLAGIRAGFEEKLTSGKLKNGQEI